MTLNTNTHTKPKGSTDSFCGGLKTHRKSSKHFYSCRVDKEYIKRQIFQSYHNQTLSIFQTSLLKTHSQSSLLNFPSKWITSRITLGRFYYVLEPAILSSPCKLWRGYVLETPNKRYPVNCYMEKKIINTRYTRSRLTTFKGGSLPFLILAIILPGTSRSTPRHIYDVPGTFVSVMGLRFAGETPKNVNRLDVPRMQVYRCKPRQVSRQMTALTQWNREGEGKLI